jgi:hypothetical protein
VKTHRGEHVGDVRVELVLERDGVHGDELRRDGRSGEVGGGGEA